MDPIKGVINKKREPLTTLKTYRCFDDCKSPVMGFYLLLVSNSASIKCGDAVYAGSE